MRSLLVLLAACANGMTACGGTATGDEAPPQKVFVTFDTTLINMGAENATTNTSSIFGATLTGYRDQQPDHDLKVAQATAGLEAILAPFKIDVVTERPDNALYDMIVIAGTAEEAGLASGLGGAASVDCFNSIPNKIVVVFGNSFPMGFGGDQLASLAVAGLGFSQGIPSSDLANDCLCWTGASCEQTTQCTFGGPGTPVAAGDTCAEGATTMDPMTEFQRVYGLASE
jgi:hypothetical protein